MDPQEAYDAFASAACFVVQTSSGQAHLFELSADQIAEVKQQMRRSDVLMLAKQYFKAKEAVEELQRRLTVFPGSVATPPFGARGPARSPASVLEPRASVTPNAKSCAMVPYVKVAPPSMASVARRHEYGLSLYSFNWALKACFNSAVGKAYLKVIKLALFLCSVTPLVILCVLLVHLCLTLGYIAFHPELFVAGFFKLVLSVPTLTDFFVQRMWNQICSELSSWFS